MSTYDVFPNSEAFLAWAIRDAAIAGLDDRVYSSLPKRPTFPLAVVQRIGGVGPVRQRLDAPNIQVSTWAESQAAAHDLAAAARTAIHMTEGGTFGDNDDDCPVSIVVTAVNDSLGLAFIPDPDTAKDRYIFGVTLICHVGPPSV